MSINSSASRHWAGDGILRQTLKPIKDNPEDYFRLKCRDTPGTWLGDPVLLPPKKEETVSEFWDGLMSYKVPKIDKEAKPVSKKVWENGANSCNKLWEDALYCPNCEDPNIECNKCILNWRNFQARAKFYEQHYEKESNMKELPELKSGYILKIDSKLSDMYALVTGEKADRVVYLYRDPSGEYRLGGWDYITTLKEDDAIFAVYGCDSPSHDILDMIRSKEYPYIWKKDTAKEMTVEEISKALGYEVKVVKG